MSIKMCGGKDASLKICNFFVIPLSQKSFHTEIIFLLKSFVCAVSCPLLDTKKGIHTFYFYAKTEHWDEKVFTNIFV